MCATICKHSWNCVIKLKKKSIHSWNSPCCWTEKREQNKPKEWNKLEKTNGNVWRLWSFVFFLLFIIANHVRENRCTKHLKGKKKHIARDKKKARKIMQNSGIRCVVHVKSAFRTSIKVSGDYIVMETPGVCHWWLKQALTTVHSKGYYWNRQEKEAAEEEAVTRKKHETK